MSDDTNQNPPVPPEELTGTDISRNDIPYAIEDIMHTAYLQYSLSVNVGRAIPDVRDGMKVGNRRIIYAMRQLGFVKNHPYAKCAKVVGEVIGNYHPHGDAAVYDTLVRMAQDFTMRCPLVDGQGNFGSIDGDGAAAYRYTECRMERLAEEMVADIDKETVDMRPTFDEKTLEPVVLPARFPNLLVNGAQGIGVGMATSIPPHNLGETIDATIALIDNPSISIRELMRYLPAPDFPTGGIIQGIRSVIALYETGRGAINIRGKASIEEDKGKERIIISEIPYGINKEQMVLKIAEMVNEKRITGISGIEDLSSSREGIKIIIDIKRGAIASVVLTQLYSLTPLEISIGAQFLVVDRNRPRTLNLKQVLEAYIDHREEVVTRRTQFDLQKAEDRDHIVQGLLIAQANITEVVRVIRESANREEAGTTLMARFELSERQAKAILEMRLFQLTNLAVDELKAEHDELVSRIDYLRGLLADRSKIMGVVKDELRDVKMKYADSRRTLVVPNESEVNMEDLIARSICVVSLSAAGYIKRVDVDTFEQQNRGGKGIRGMRTKEEDYVAMLRTCCTHDILMFFTNKGQMHWLKAYEIPEGARDGQGKALVNLLQLQSDERVRAIIPVADINQPDTYVAMCTRNGMIKKTPLSAFKNLRKLGVKAIVLLEGDDLIDAILTDGKEDLMLSSAHGMANRFRGTDVRPMSRSARGVRGMKLQIKGTNESSTVVAMCAVKPDDQLLVITANGMGKRSPIGDPLQGDETELPAVEEVTDEATANEATLDDDAVDAPEVEAPEVDEPEVDEPEVDDEADEADAENGTGDVLSNSVLNCHYRRTRRGNRGVISIKLKGDDTVVAALQIDPKEDPEVIITSVGGQVVRIKALSARLTNRWASGVIMMKFNGNDKVASATLVDKLSDEEIAANLAKQRETEELAAREAEFKQMIAQREQERNAYLEEHGEGGNDNLEGNEDASRADADDSADQ